MDYASILKDFIKMLGQNHIPYMLVGGIAVDFYGMPRPTFDIDVVVILKEQDIDRLVKGLRRLKFSIQKGDVKQILKIGNRVIAKAPTIPYRIDIWFIKSEYDKVAFGRRKQHRVFNKNIWFISAEDLILSKLIAGRIQDREDILGVLKRQQGKLDLKYLNHWARVLDQYGQLRQLVKRSKG